MYKISKIDAFSLIVKTLDLGDEKTANKMMSIVMKSIKKSKGTTTPSLYIKIEKEEEAKLFKAFLIDCED